MATKKKEEELAAPEAQSGYDTSGLENRQQVEEAMAGAGYRPGQSVTNAANALKEWQDKRPEAYQSSYQNRINEVLDRLLARENFAYSYTQDPLYRQYAQQYTQNAHNASADAAAQAAAEQYLENVQTLSGRQTEVCQQLVDESQQKADTLLNETQTRCQIMEAETQARCQAMEAEMNLLRQQLQKLKSENENLIKENQKLKKALSKKELNLIKQI